MNSVRWVWLILGATLWAAATPSRAQARIAAVISPTAIVIEGESSRAVLALPGTPVFYCGARPFNNWAQQLVGQVVLGSKGVGATVNVDGKPVEISELFAQAGWLRPPVLSDAAQSAMTEGRGGWACATTATIFDALHSRVDPKVLAGIALNESAWHGRPWPWTLNVAGRSGFFRSREEAFTAIEALRRVGRCDFDVGIMQINWCYQGQRFTSAWDALDPQTNVRVAEDILNENFARTHSIAKAIAYYHSANPGPGQAYLASFVTHLAQIENGR